MPRAPLHRRSLLLPLLGVLALWLAGCTENERFSYATEADEPNYREGVALLKTGRKQEALTAFLKVIDKRGEDSAESHLEVGLLYLEHINDPLSAIYHFKKFLYLRPNSQQAPLVKQRIDAATRDFARTLPAQPLENKLQRVDLVAALDRLKQENESLKQELATVKAGRDVGTFANAPVEVALPTVATVASEPEPVPVAESASAGDFNFSLDTLPTVKMRRPTSASPARTEGTSTPTRPAAQTPAAKSTQLTSTTPATKSTGAAAVQAPAQTAGGRRHVVQPKETLSQIALKYYKNRAKWRDIYAANRGVMKSETDLKVGMELKIP